MDLTVHYYLGKYTPSSGLFTWRELEYTSEGDRVRYRKCEGLEDKGKPKNIYTETYADSNIVRADYPRSVTLEATEITLDVVIIRGDRVQTRTYDRLFSYFSSGPTIFWDTQRKRMAVMHLKDATTPVKDTYLGTPYIEAEFKFMNLEGQCPIIEDAYDGNHLPLVEARAALLLAESLT